MARALQVLRASAISIGAGLLLGNSSCRFRSEHRSGNDDDGRATLLVLVPAPSVIPGTFPGLIPVPVRRAVAAAAAR